VNDRRSRGRFHYVISYVVRLATALFAFAAFNIPVPAAAQTPASLTGVVQDQTQQPLDGATLTISGPVNRSMSTDAHGAFAVTLPPGVFSVTVSKPGYETTTIDTVVVVAGQTAQFTAQLAPASLSSLAEIGRSIAAGAPPINTSTAAVSYLSGRTILDQGSLELRTSLNELPGVISSSPGIWRGKGDNGGLLGQNGAAPATVSVVEIRGALDYETASLIDGHSITTGRTGSFNNAFLSPYMLQDVQVVKGPGATVPNINNAIGGTVNFRTLEPTAQPIVSADVGTDGHGSFENFRFTGTSSDRHWSWALDYATQSTNAGIHVNSLLIPGANDYGNGVFVNGAPAVTQIVTTTPTPYYGVSAYAFDNAVCCSPLQSYLASQNELAKLRYSFSPETSLTLTYLASQADYNPEATAAFNNPTLSFSPPASGYTGPDFQPTCCIRAVNQNPVGINVQNLFEAEFRTALGTNSLIARYYQTGTMNYQATAPGPSGSITINGQIYGSALLNGSMTPTIFNGTNATIFTPGSYEGLLDVDQLRGYTAEFDHPSGANVYSLAFDQTKSTTYSFENYSPPTPSETIVPGGSGQTLSDALARGQFQLSPSLSAILGVYYTVYTNHYTQDGGLTFQDSTHSFVGPRFGMTWRADNATSVRLAAGSSIAPAYVYLLTNPAGPPIPNDQGDPQYYTQNLNSGDVQPETAFGYDLGADHRVGGIVLSSDIYLTTLHGQFLQSETLAGTFASNNVIQNAGVQLPLYDVKTSNLGTSKYYGFELSADKETANGLGGRASLSLTRAYVVSVPAGFYNTASGAFTTNLGVIPGVNFQPNGATYNGLAPARVPYAQGYGELNFNSERSVLAKSALGVTYYGNNNAYNEPPFFVLHVALDFRLGKATTLALVADNLTGQYNTPYYTLYEGIPVPLANGQLGSTDAGNYGPTTYRITLHHRF
jgi:Carboxypeptidase regulatory-like domain/TonB dependent receptor/TonB-dependent Receptor Plug Domain